MIKDKINALFIGNSYMASLFGQENMIPVFLKTRGVEMSVETLYAPGQTLGGHIENNLGRVTDVQREEIEKGRVGGWFTDEKCDWFYETFRAKKGQLDAVLEHRLYDLALVLFSSREAAEPHRYNTFGYGRQLFEKLRANNPDVDIIIMMPWTIPAEPELLPRFVWVAEKLALENGARISPVGEVFHAIRERQPDVSMHRSAKDPHQNEDSCFLIAYTCIAAIAEAAVDDLPGQFTPAGDDPYVLSESVAKSLRAEAWRAFNGRQQQLQRKTLESLKEPELIKARAGVEPDLADRRVLAIGNASIGADGRVWQELVSGLKQRNKVELYIEDLTDDAATFESVLANNDGRLTDRQKRIVDQVVELQNQMGKTLYDMDELDGMGDYPIQMIRERFAARKGRLDQALSSNILWDAVLLIPFRGAWDPSAHNFIESGRRLADKIRRACPGARLLILEPVLPKESCSDVGVQIEKNVKELAEACGLEVVHILSEWRARMKTETPLYAHLHTPNTVGVQILAEALRGALGWLAG